jgi:hypothetical protein
MDKLKGSNYSIVFALVIWGFFLLGTLFPDFWWGSHFISFLPPILKIGLLIVSFLLIAFNNKISAKTDSIINRYFGFNKSWPIYLSTIIAIGLYAFPITNDFYGDAPYFMEELSKKTAFQNSDLLQHIFNYNFWNPKTGEETTLGIVQFIANNIKFDFVFAFKILGSICAGIFCFVWIKLVSLSVTNKTSQVLLILLGVCSPMIQLFQGHQEIYGPILCSIVWFFVRLKKYNNKGGKLNMFILLFALLLCLKFHITSFALIPVVLMAIYNQVKTNISFSFMIKYIYAILAVIGICAYLFIFEDYNDEREMIYSTNYLERVFLPILSPEAPLDKYTLFHLNHFSDFLNQSFIWSPMLLLLIGIVTINRKKINWESPQIVQGFFAAITYLSVFFLLNPLLGMQMDWDLFCIPGIIILCFLVLTWSAVDQTKPKLNLTPIALALSLFIIAPISVNASKEMLSQRLLSTGKSAFKGYWIGSIKIIKNAVSIYNQDLDYIIDNTTKAAEDLEPYAFKGKDIEMSRLYQGLGMLYRKHKKDYNKAQLYHEKSAEYYYENGDNLLGLTEALFLLKKFKKAYPITADLVKYKYPNELKSQSMALHVALEAGLGQEAFNHCTSLLKIQPKNELFKFIIVQLQKGANPKVLAKNFRSN